MGSDGTHPDLLLVSPLGLVTQSTLRSAVGVDVSGEPWFRAARERALAANQIRPSPRSRWTTRCMIGGSAWHAG